jgi:conjugative transfer signal peptidase TraF
MVPFWVMGIAAVLIPAAAFAMRAWGPTLLINETRSEPRGLYRLVAHAARDYRRGMTVVFPVPDEVRALVIGRHWLKDGVPLLKELRGLAGDCVCIFADRLEINGHLVGPVFARDRAGLPLPQHPGCFTVQPGSFFAASGYLDQSFDGRYFGALPLRVLQGEARPVWTF